MRRGRITYPADFLNPCHPHYNRIILYTILSSRVAWVELAPLAASEGGLGAKNKCAANLLRRRRRRGGGGSIHPLHTTHLREKASGRETHKHNTWSKKKIPGEAVKFREIKGEPFPESYCQLREASHKWSRLRRSTCCCCCAWPPLGSSWPSDYRLTMG